MMMPRPCPSGSRLLKTFFKSKKFVYNGKMTNFKGMLGKRAILHHTDQIYVLFCTRLYLSVANFSNQSLTGESMKKYFQASL